MTEPLTPNKTKDTLAQLTDELLTIEDENRTLRQILASSSDPILITTAEIRIIYVNPAWERLTGYMFDEVEGKNPKILQSGKTPKHVHKKLWKALEKNQPFTTEQVIDKRKDGSLYQIHSTIYPVHKNGKTIYYVQIQHDITQRVQLDELKSEFFSVISHELKTPITVLKLLTQRQLATLQKGKAVKLTGKELQLFDQELNKLTGLISDMLDTSRVETGKLRMNFELFDLTKLTQATIEKFRIVGKKHTLIVDAEEACTVVGDQQRIEQVLLNLLTNAIKYSPEGSIIETRLVKQDFHALLSVKDQGRGIATKDHKAIFDKFYQVKKREGFGLGLYIVKEIIKRHKGKIWVESEEGKGSTFYLTLRLDR